ncbi:hypothetical protein N7340_17360 [Comamonas aquatica]|uniref:hypothetical protein n=1 Tax=Comamonas aquatica TaxID=225991 RepID=UPI002448FF13|nr:hypothetical protein [Comamonas aquatica]MDH0373518.1 hypothetical protein [Comamonas aquatica]
MSRYFSLMLCAPAVMLMACSLESKPDDAFLDSLMILRPGVDDARVTVRKYVDFLETRSQHDGSPIMVTGWERTNAGYALNLKLKVPTKLEFIWSKQEKVALLQYADAEGQRIPALTFYMLTMSSPVHPSKIAKAQELQSRPSPSTSAPSTAPASSVGAATSEAPPARQADMDAESKGVPSDPVPTATPTPTPQTAPQADTAQAANRQTTAVPNLCSPEEMPVFACSTGKKRASLCMSNDESQLTYRLAPLGGAPEMVYPTHAAAASTAFKPGEYVSSNGQTLPFMSFDKGSFRYAVYGTTTTMQGILVEQNGKRIANLNCQEDRLSEMGTAWFQRLYLGLDRDKRPLQLP